MKKEITKISILKSSKVLIAIYTVFGLFYTLIGIPMIMFGRPQLKPVGTIYLFGPIWMAIIGFVGFVVFAALYNFFARIFGGVEIEVEHTEVTQQQ